MANPKNKATASEPAAAEKAAAEDSPEANEDELLTCRKSAIQIGEKIYRFRDKVSPNEVAKLPARLRRWFK